MNSLLDNDEAAQTRNEQDMHEHTDREISLGTTTILGIFFALAVLCAVFFGFGYSLGAKHAAATPIASEPVGNGTFNNFKPAPGSPLSPAAAKLPPPETVTVPYNASSGTAPTASPAPYTTVSAAGPNTPPHSTPGSSSVAPQSNDPVSAPAAATQFEVQVAAVSHQEDADLISSTLKRRGYAVAIRQEPQDKLLHVQIGPFPAKKDAEVMRQRLLADGFNAYIK